MLSSGSLDLHLCFFLSRRIEVPRIVDFTNPSWIGDVASLSVLDVVHSAFGLHKCVDTSLRHMQVEDELIWPFCQVGRPRVEPGDLAWSRATWSTSQ